ncbi:MAG: iron-sulfur cluster assembly accessory protein [Xanthomonadales bacterium]|nr:iron-sulfur cluster assembly accessory protein [Xanthomonadales bacterium]
MQKPTDSTVNLSDAAMQRVRRFLSTDPSAIGLRFGVKRTGCSGWGYNVDLAREARDDDTVIEVDGIRVLIDADSLPMLSGTEIDFVREGLNQQFVFRNPNAAGECGCGESFTTEDVGDVGA